MLAHRARARERVTSARRRRQPLDMAGTRLIGVKGEFARISGINVSRSTPLEAAGHDAPQFLARVSYGERTKF